jgi:subtilisin family serine protease
VVDEIGALGIARVTTDNAGFSKALTASGKTKGVVRNHSVGSNTKGTAHRFAEERAVEDRALYAAKAKAGGAGAAAASSPKKSGPETFSSLQWGMQMIGATPNLAHATATGDGVTVGIIDTGIDSTHADLAPNFNAALSQNFTTDIPDIDGPCEAEPDQSCEDPATVDEGGHGTHVAGIVAAAANGIGVAGVAPDATLVNLRAGQDSGCFFFETIAAIAYAGENGIDVVNMSFYTDPWLYNCDSRDDIVEGDVSDEELAEQAMIRAGIIEAVNFARGNGVTLVAAAGNQHSDLAAPTRFDDTSPDFPLGIAKPLTVTNDCLDLPSEAPGVIQVASIGPSKVKSDFSTWGLGAIDVAAPGGWFRDYFGTNDFMEPENMVLSSYPLAVAQEEGGSTARAASATPSTSGTAPPVSPAPTTSTCRARRWRRRTPPGSWR